MAHHGKGNRALTAARLADQPIGLTRVNGERDVAYGGQTSLRPTVRNREPLDVEHGWSIPVPRSRQTSGRLGAHARSARRRPSATRLIATTSEAMASVGARTIHGLLRKKMCVSFTMAPQSGEGGCTPSPRKLREAAA